MRFNVRIAMSLFVLLTGYASSELVTGTIKNGTTNKPAAGDEVILFTLRQGMEESGRTKTDAAGKFSLAIDDPSAPHLLRAIHHDVNYHRMVPPGTTQAEIAVYDVAKKVDAVSLVADVLRLQAQQGDLRGVRLFSISNNSMPPLTQMNGQNFAFQLPEGAKIDSTMAKSGNGQPINVDLIPQAGNRTAFDYPLRPGETQFQVAFHLPYDGQAKIDIPTVQPTQHFVITLPISMTFSATPGSGFQSMQDPQRSGSVVQVASNTQVGQNLSFSISGFGSLPEEGAGNTGAATGSSGEPSAMPAVQGGPPVESGFIHDYGWFVLAGIVIVVVIGGLYISGRSKTPVAVKTEEFAGLRDVKARPPESHGESLLEVLKEEIFQLEIDLQQGRMSSQEYETTKAALSHTLSSALKRAGRIPEDSQNGVAALK
jgi:hypothetical protein